MHPVGSLFFFQLLPRERCLQRQINELELRANRSGNRPHRPRDHFEDFFAQALPVPLGPFFLIGGGTGLGIGIGSATGHKHRLHTGQLAFDMDAGEAGIVAGNLVAIAAQRDVVTRGAVYQRADIAAGRADAKDRHVTVGVI